LLKSDRLSFKRVITSLGDKSSLNEKKPLIILQYLNLGKPSNLLDIPSEISLFFGSRIIDLGLILSNILAGISALNFIGTKRGKYEVLTVL